MIYVKSNVYKPMPSTSSCFVYIYIYKPKFYCREHLTPLFPLLFYDTLSSYIYILYLKVSFSFLLYFFNVYL